MDPSALLSQANVLLGNPFEGSDDRASAEAAVASLDRAALDRLAATEGDKATRRVALAAALVDAAAGRTPNAPAPVAELAAAAARCTRALEQLAAILPTVSAYSAGLLDHLFRGSLVLLARAEGVTIAAGGTDFAAGKIELFWDDRTGVRTRYAEVEVKGGAVGKALARAARPPAGAVRVVALFRGADKAGQPLIATGLASLE